MAERRDVSGEDLHCRTDSPATPAAPAFSERAAASTATPATSHEGGGGGGDPTSLPGDGTGSAVRFTTQHEPPLCKTESVSAADWVRLLVGGKVFTTTLTTLLRDPASLLFQLAIPLRRPRAGGEGGEAVVELSADAPVDTDTDNCILLDLDPDYFAPVLNYLRHGIVAIPPGVSPQGVLAVAEYLCVQGVVQQISSKDRHHRQLLFSWGSGSSGELGSQVLQDSSQPIAVQVAPFGNTVVQVALGANYSCVLVRSGDIYTFGNGDWGQLGLGNPKDLDEHPVDRSVAVVVPRRVPFFERHPALQVSAGYAFAMAITQDHHVYFWGNNNHGQSGLGPRFFDYRWKKIDEPRLVESLEGLRIVQVGCGSFFTLALSESGTLYSWGLVDCLGLGLPEEVRARLKDLDLLGESLSNEKRTVVLTPQPVRFPATDSGASSRIVRIHAGQWHSGAINAAGELFTWGVGFQGRLGHGNKEPVFVPTKVCGALDGHVVVDVACGSFHTVALTDRGAVFCWGDNANGQCGTSSCPEAVLMPYRVLGLEFVAGGVARSVSCGRQHTTVVMEGPQPGCTQRCCQLDYRGRPRHSHGQVYVFGEGIAARSAGFSGSAANGPGGNSNNGGNNFAAGRGGQQGGSDAGPSLARTKAQYQLIHGLLPYDVHTVVSGLHHTFVYAEELDTDMPPAERGRCCSPSLVPSRPDPAATSLSAALFRPLSEDVLAANVLTAGHHRHRSADQLRRPTPSLYTASHAPTTGTAAPGSSTVAMASSAGRPSS